MENNSEILQQLICGNPEEIEIAILTIKENGDLNIAEMLLEKLGDIDNVHSITIITNLLADIKDTNFRNILLQKIQSTTDIRLKSEMLHIVWESSLDYSSHWRLFMEMIKNEDFIVAFEASTIIENFICTLNTDQKQELKQELLTLPESKHSLCINILEELS